MILRSNFNFPARSLTTRVEDINERAKRLRQFRKGDLKILTCYDMLNEGIDVPDVDFLVYLRVTHSRSIFLQQLGRGLRYKEGKTLLVLDFLVSQKTPVFLTRYILYSVNAKNKTRCIFFQMQ